MQLLTGGPRAHLTEAQVRDLLTAPQLEVTGGLELLDTSNAFVADISDDLVDGSVSWDNRDALHGSVRLDITRELAWGRDRVRPYVILNDGTTEAKFYLGVYVLTAPDDRRGEDPKTYSVTGYDLLSLLSSTGPADTYVIDPTPGENVIDNPGFETDTSGWESNSVYGAYSVATFTRTTSKASAGVASLEVTWPAAGSAGASWVNTFEPGLTVGKTYRIKTRVWVPADGPNQFRIDVAFQGSGAWKTVAKEQWVDLEYLWTAKQTSAYPGVAAKNPVAGTKTWVDEFTMTPLSTTYIDAARALVDLSGLGAQVWLDGTRQTTVLAATMVWALTNTPASWLRILTDLLAAIGYTPPWMDETGALRSRPYMATEDRPVEWTLDTSDESTDLVDPSRTVRVDVGDVANWWRFVRSGMDTTPVEGDGIYTPPRNQSLGPNSVDALGREIRKFERINAADQETLVAQGDQIRAADMASVTTIDLTIDPLPIMSQDDVFEFIDEGVTMKIQAASWTVNLNGDRGQLQLGGAPASQSETAQEQASATITATAPLRVVVDGATAESFANALDAATYNVGDRVTVTVRNPRPPLVQGVES